MTIREAIKRADAIRNNAIRTEEKVRWLAELDGKIALDVLLLGHAETAQFEYSPDDIDHELLVKFPHENLYIMYLMAMTDMMNGEYNLYNTENEAYEKALGEFINWFARNYEPAGGYEGGKHYEY